MENKLVPIGSLVGPNALPLPLVLTHNHVIQNHENENVRYIGQGEAPHRKYKRLKLGGGHVYDCSSV
jgi:hypothetical protein